MKKLLSFLVLALVSTFVLVGCKEKEPAMPTTPVPTNAPAAP
ncbi:MAG: hypothetical protein ABIP71_08045 [Verrucomicrobiota bacterium]